MRAVTHSQPTYDAEQTSPPPDAAAASHTQHAGSDTHSQPTYDARQTSPPPDAAAAASTGTWCSTHTTCGQ